MQNVPWHEEVVYFVKQLTDRLEGYEIASEHEHSNCILIANTKVSSGDEHEHSNCILIANTKVSSGDEHEHSNCILIANTKVSSGDEHSIES